MKRSVYNYLLHMNGNAVLYNTLSDEMALLEPALAEMYQRQGLNDIRGMHPRFHQFLLSKGFLVGDEADEFSDCVNKWASSDNDPEFFSVTVNPTLDCNMRCWYCYEKHDSSRTMDDTVLNSVIRLINAKTSDGRLKRLGLSFFGGEPLMKYSGVVRPLIEHARAQCEKNNIQLSLSLVTNGFLLTPGIAKYLQETGLPVHFQITMDGNRILHNNTRHTATGFGSYDIILSNLSLVCALQNVSVTLRLNYTRENIDSFLDLAGDLAASCGKHRESISIDLQRVWQDSGSPGQLDSRIKRVKEAFTDKGFAVSEEKGVVKYRCYGDRNNHAVVNYDGNIYHCTARDFTPETAEGVLNPDGTIDLNDKAALRNSTKWGNDACHRCRAYPLCHGGCSQQKLESAHIRGCIKGYNQKQVNDLIERRIHYLIDQSKVCSKQ